uniref:Sporulation domain-containing protein n=1 Tax=uncultured bacterium UPO68_UPO87 TaxID=1776988 RepID=A0A126SYY4_9BACT|nr:sporulation domain-containing protein [uncultured bacterium UPO68_UPO87]
MFDKVQRDRFWLVLGAILIGLFVMQKERGVVEPRQASAYDRGGMTYLVEQTRAIPTVSRTAARPVARPQVQMASWSDDPYAGLVTGSISSAAPRPLARPGRDSSIRVASLAPVASTSYYVQLGAYSGIDRASRRYFDILGREPDLRGSERVSIDTARVSGEEVHRVRMGPFASEASARAACARAAIPADECAVVVLN